MPQKERTETEKFSAKKKLGIYCVLSGLVFLFFCFNQNFRKPVYHCDSEIWADKAGYYVYLPATFIYSWNGKKMPPKVDSLTGGGFRINETTGSIYTKYPPGEAVLELPFFLTAHIYTLITDPQNATGFTKPYHASRLVSGVFWLFLGFYFMGLTALKYGKKINEILWLLFLFLCGTNAAYFTIWQPSMSHGFALFSIAWLIWLLQDAEARNRWLWIGLALGLAGSIRGVNLVLLLPVFIMYAIKYWQNLKKLVPVFWALAGFILGIFPFILQLFYLSAIGTKPYAGESFTHASNPWFAEIYFSATNGIAIYTPLMFVLMLFLFLGIFKKEHQKPALYISASFFAVTWLYASWWVPTMGCGIGHRSFIDFLPLLFLYTIIAVPSKIYFNTYFILFSIISIIYTGYLSYNYPGCLNDGMGQQVWRWSEYMRVLNHP